MQQALAMLQAPALELRALVQQEMMQNPVLEDITEIPDTPSMDEVVPDEILDRQIDLIRQIDEDDRAFRSLERAGKTFSKDDEERRQFFFDSLVEQESLAGHLSGQLRMAARDQDMLKAGEEIIGNLDPDGFLRTPLDEIQRSSGVSPDVAEQALLLIHTFHPVGVGARDLRECLLIQLDRLGKSEDVESAVVARHLDDLAHHRFDSIAKSLAVDSDRVREASQFISTLDPKPGRAFQHESRADVIVPEVFIDKINGEWVVTLAQEAVPQIRISSVYKDMLATDGDQSELRSYLREKIRAGKSLIQSLQQRQQTIVKIAQEIVRRQLDFFENGISHLKPLTLAQVAAEVGVHETTVSRAIAAKYAQTPRGVFELKFFFTPGYQSSSGQTYSNKSIKDSLKDIVDKEDKRKPYSDEEIIKIFSERGIKLARRTIAKYRAELHILPSSLRKAV